MRLINISFILALLCLPVAAKGIGHDLRAFFNRSTSTNVTSPKAFKDQAGGYYTGGSLVTRNQVRSAQLATIQMPGFRAGCGGIDAWTGGFSHISADRLVEMLQNIGSAAKAYAFMLAVQTVSPTISTIMNELNAIATQVNQMNISSCEVAATTLGGIWPKTDQSSKHLCQAMGSNLGAFSDWSAARQGCGAKGDRGNILAQKGRDPRYQDMLVGEFNLSWKAIQANHFLSEDQALAQLFLTLVGSIISKKNGEAFQVTTLPGYADRDELLTALLEGGSTKVYKCSTAECLDPVLSEITIPNASALLRRTQDILESLVYKIYEDLPIGSAEQDFLNSTQLPVYKMLNVMTAFRKGYAPVDIHQYGELIALDILYKYVVEVLDIVHESVVHLKSVQVDEVHIERFTNALRLARERITSKRQSAYQQMDNTLSFIQATQLIEKQMHAMLGSMLDDQGWA
ncbi:conjugal transfer protein TraH [Candidatus Odyssella thessalonicensis]|uniref:conjugal transfer protein TraH n=1 Tax=Candidatus Odyssella thessalonicensis TaxID=84647 RepID=UPI000225ACEB|nr:conjugal transfer protein TraH [Candidatus Odyssella thessalonicensis]